MHLKKFAFLYLAFLTCGLLILSFNDILFIIKAQSQSALVSHHVPGGVETYYRLGGKYQEKTLKPAISYSVDGQNFTFIPDYSCKEGCHPVGEFLTIFYKSENPQEVLVSSFAGMWKYKIYFLIIMGVLLVTTLPYLYINKQPVSESNG